MKEPHIRFERIVIQGVNTEGRKIELTFPSFRPVIFYPYDAHYFSVHGFWHGPLSDQQTVRTPTFQELLWLFKKRQSAPVSSWLFGSFFVH